MLNLIANAIQYSPERALISFVVRKENDCVILAVKDQGPGIPISFDDQIFEPFQQLSKGKKKEVQGTGLGLYLVRKYMEIHGGKVRVDYDYTEGCSIELTFNC